MEKKIYKIKTLVFDSKYKITFQSKHNGKLQRLGTLIETVPLINVKLP